MEMPTPCERCGDIFDLYDGLASPRTKGQSPQIIICEDCAKKEEEEIELEEEIQELKDEIADAEDTIRRNTLPFQDHAHADRTRATATRLSVD